MVNQQKGVQQEAAYSAVVICIPVHAYIIFSCLYDPFWVKNNIGTGIPSLKLHYRQFLVAILLLIYHPYPSSFYEMIFALVPLIFLS